MHRRNFLKTSAAFAASAAGGYAVPFQDQKTRYISDINTTLSDDRQTLIMSEYYREPGLERIRDWVFERQ